MSHNKSEESSGVYEETESREITAEQTRIGTVRGWFSGVFFFITKFIFCFIS